MKVTRITGCKISEEELKNIDASKLNIKHINNEIFIIMNENSYDYEVGINHTIPIATVFNSISFVIQLSILGVQDPKVNEYLIFE